MLHTITSTHINRFYEIYFVNTGNFWHRCCWGVAIRWWFVMSSPLNNVSALPGETWTWSPEIVFSVTLYTVSQKRHCEMQQAILIILCRQSLRPLYQVQCANIISRIAISFSRQGMQHDWKGNFRVHVSPRSGETVVRRRGITNHHLIVCSLSNIIAQNN